ncbi:DUF6708 domain-containing protein [Pseudomonas kielensis]|uniref:DUF6708 domain-containing protein n=1 Tax=Pseudomonas kielensis TaxID=2762577 RepID=UPI002AD3CFD6|nr:DUF6708 domain-containing protein [Pseudomonas kielensis]
MLFTEPLLDEPAPCWKYDLPGPNQPPTTEPYPSVLTNTPNYVNDVYLELPCASMRVRGVGIWGAGVCFLAAFAAVILLLDFIVEVKAFPPLILCVGFFLALTVSVWGGVYFWRMDTEAPSDEPIRFNRLRRKVYVYRFHHDGLHPFSRTAWFVRAEVYDWDDLRAEACSIYGPMGTGGLIQTVTLAVVKPGTNKVIERFHFAHGIQQGETYWAMAQLFMQQGPQTLPTFPSPPRDWNNENVPFNLARRLAPKVQWPAEMDLESRTAP